MNEVIWATPLYEFLRYCNDSSLERTILDCGAGGDTPPLQLFFEFGYRTWGIEISDDALNKTRRFCREKNMKLNILKADIRRIPFRTQTFSFAYSYNTLPLLSKKDVRIAMTEIERIMKPGGLCFVNFVSVDDEAPADSYYEDDEPDRYFANFKIIHKEKRIALVGKEQKQAYIDYIAKKR